MILRMSLLVRDEEMINIERYIVMGMMVFNGFKKCMIFFVLSFFLMIRFVRLYYG